jgi:glyoxylase-like metal-dependent hydrolase (beta-lactamase superfamily II)
MTAILAAEAGKRKAMTRPPLHAGLIPDLRLVRAPNPSAMTERGTNTWIVGRGAVAVIDPGPGDEGHLGAILAALDPTERVSHILVTHPHADHSALAPALAQATGAPVLAFGTVRDGMTAAMAALGTDGTGGEGLDPGFSPDIRLSDGETVNGAGWALTAIHTPGHLGSHLCFRWGTLGFSGDHVMAWSTSLVSPPEGDMGAYRRSLARLASQYWSGFLPGHGDPVADPAARLAELAAHRTRRETEILSALQAAPATTSGLVRAIYTDLPAHLHRAAERNVFAHLLDLVHRNVVESDGTPSLAAQFRLVHAKRP